MIYEQFPPELIAIQQELLSGFHPELLALLADGWGNGQEHWLPVIATHVGVVLDGEYSYDDQVELCGILVEKLKEKRQHRDSLHKPIIIQ